MEIVDVDDEVDRTEWEEVAASDPTALIEHTPAWIDAIVAASRFSNASLLYRLSDGRRFVLPLVRRGPTVGPRSGFASGWGIGGLVGAELDAEAVSAISTHLASSRVVYTHIRPNPLQADAWAGAATGRAGTVPRRAHIVNLEGGAEATAERFRKSGRRGISRAEKAGVEVSLHLGGEMLEVYYQHLYLPSLARWAKRQQEPLRLALFRANLRDPLRKLQMIAATLGPTFRLYLATVDGQPVAGNIVLWGPTNAHATRGAFDYELGAKTNANYATDWAAIRDASDAGFVSYQMGESGQNTGLADYKERFGAKPIDYCEYRFERLPLLSIDAAARKAVKRVIGFKDS